MEPNKIKVLHINCNYMGTKLHQIMIEHLNPYVAENKIFCPIYSGSELVTKPNDNVVVAKCFTLMDRAFFYHKQKKIISSLEKNIEVRKYNIIHAYTLFTDGNSALELSKNYNIPYVVAVRATDLQFFQFRPYLRKRGLEILRNASRILFLSDTTRGFMLEKYVSDKEREIFYGKSKIIPNGIDDFWLNNCYTERKVEETQKHLDNKTVRIICVAQIIKRKNIPLLQKAIAILNQKGWNIHLTVVGKAVNKKELAKINKDHNTTYLSPVTKEKLIEYYRNADIFVLPSKGETFGLVYAEAMSQGLPVIYSKDEGFDGQFADGEVGYAVNAKDVKEIVSKIEAVCHNYLRIEENVAKNASKFRWDDICVHYIGIYNELCENY